MIKKLPEKRLQVNNMTKGLQGLVKNEEGTQINTSDTLEIRGDSVQPQTPPLAAQSEAIETVHAAPQPQRDWTIMVYLGADCNLEPFMTGNVVDLEKIGSDDKVNILAQLDRGANPKQEIAGGWPHARRFYITKGSGDYSKPLASKPDDSLPPSQSINMSTPENVADFIKWGMNNFPAKHYMFIYNDHGAGWKGAIEDDSHGGWMNLNDLKDGIEKGKEAQKAVVEGIQQAVQETGKPVDIVGFDACLMSQLEVATSLREVADYLIASEEVIGGVGWPYSQIFSPEVLGKLKKEIHKSKDNTFEPEDLLKKAIAETAKTPKATMTMSATNLKKVGPLLQATDELASSVIEYVKSQPTAPATQTGKNDVSSAITKAMETKASPSPQEQEALQYLVKIINNLPMMVKQINNSPAALKEMVSRINNITPEQVVMVNNMAFQTVSLPPLLDAVHKQLETIPANELGTPAMLLEQVIAKPFLKALGFAGASSASSTQPAEPTPPPDRATIIKEDIQKAQHYSNSADIEPYRDYRDLGSIAKNLIQDERIPQDSKIKQAANKYLDVLKDALVAEQHLGAKMENSTGLSVYTPLKPTRHLKGYDSTDFAKQTKWDEMLASLGISFKAPDGPRMMTKSGPQEEEELQMPMYQPSAEDKAKLREIAGRVTMSDASDQLEAFHLTPEQLALYKLDDTNA